MTSMTRSRDRYLMKTLPREENYYVGNHCKTFCLAVTVAV